MSVIIPELQHVRLRDGTYAIVLPVTTVDQVYYDVANKETIRKVVDEKLNLSGGEMTGGVSLNLGDGFKRYKDVSVFNHTDSSLTGICKIKLPKFYDDSLIVIEVSGMSLDTKSSWSLIATCKLCSDVTSSAYNSVRVSGSGPFKNVYFADDGDTVCLCLGETTSAWKNECFYIDSVTIINDEDILDDWKEGYELSIVPSVAQFSHLNKCFALSNGKIEIRRNIVDISTEENSILFMGGTIREYDPTLDTLSVFMNGVKLIEGIHYTIVGEAVVAVDPLTFGGTDDEPLHIVFELTKNSVPTD